MHDMCIHWYGVWVFGSEFPDTFIMYVTPSSLILIWVVNIRNEWAFDHFNLKNKVKWKSSTSLPSLQSGVGSVK